MIRRLDRDIIATLLYISPMVMYNRIYFNINECFVREERKKECDFLRVVGSYRVLEGRSHVSTVNQFQNRRKMRRIRKV